MPKNPFISLSGGVIVPLWLNVACKERAQKVLALLLVTLSITTAFAEESNTQRCVELNRIDLDYNKILDKNQQRKLLKKYMGRCIDGKLLKAVVADVSAFYMNRGYITTHAYLKAQNIHDGNIQINVLQGFVNSIVDAETKSSNTAIDTAFAFQKGELLNLRDLETALEMMNRPSSSQASFAIKPGAAPGASVVEVKDERLSPYHLKIGVGGRKNLNDKNLYMTGEFTLDNPLNINDILKVNYNGSRVQKTYQSNYGVEINYSFPIASYLLEIVGTDFSYRQGVNGINDTYLSSGATQDLRVRLSKVLFRNQKNKLSAALSEAIRVRSCFAHFHPPR